MCIFCRQDMRSDDLDVESLLCGHSFHAQCIRNCMEIIDKPKTECCPMRCHQSTFMGDPEAADVDGQQVADTNIENQQDVASDDEEVAFAARIQ